MSPATAWTELSVTDTGWQQAVPSLGNPDDDYYIDVIFEGTVFFNPGVTHTELSVAATAATELTAPSTSWTEVTI